MDLDRLKGAWQAQDIAEPAARPADLSSLMARLARLDRDLQRRDVREYLAACLVMAIFGWRAAVTDDLLVRVGALIVVAGAMFIIVWSRRAVGPARRAPFTGDLPMVQFCRRELEKVEAQVRLLQSVWWWYLTPTIAGTLLMVVPNAQPMLLKVGVGAFVLAVGAVIHWMNRAAARHHLQPLRDELRRRLEELEAL